MKNDSLRNVAELDGDSPKAIRLAGDCDLTHSRLFELVRLHAAGLLGCREGVETHTRKLLHLGESMGRIAQVASWSESELFTPRERTALALTEAFALFEDDMLGPIIDGAARVLTHEETIGIVLSVGSVLDWSTEQSKKAA